MNRSFYSNLAFLFFVNVLVKPFWILGIERTVQNRVGADEYGLYFALFNFSILFQILLDFGINNFNNRSVARDKGFIAANLSDIFTLKLLLAVVYAAFTLWCAFILHYNAHQVFLLSLLVISQVISSFLLYARSNISGMHFFRIDSLLSVTDKLLMIIICGFLLWGPYRENFTIEWFIYAQIAALVFTFFAALVVVIIKARLPPLHIDFGRVRALIGKAFPYALLGLLMTVYYRIDGVMLERMLPDGDYEAGVYAASFRLMDAANNMLGVLFATLLLPIFARMLSEGKNVHELAGTGFRLIMVAALFISAASFFYRGEIIGTLYHHPGSYWADVFGMLMPSFIGVCTVYIYGTLLTANGSLQALNMIAVGGMVLNIVLNYQLIPQYKAMGATIATLVTQTLVALAHLYATRQIIPFKLSVRQVSVFASFIIAMLLVLAGTRQLPIPWHVGILIGAAGTALLALVMRVWDLKDVLRLVQSKEDQL